MANTFVKIQTVTAGSAVSILNFTSIPQTYTDLQLVASVRSVSVAAFDQLLFTFNSNTSGVYSYKVLQGYSGAVSNGSNTGEFNASGGYAPAANATSSVFSNTQIYISNYASANFKSFGVDATQENNSATESVLHLRAGLFSSTTAISSIQCFLQSGNFAQYSSITLYGIKSS
jgi:hypothetical protein